MICRQTKKSGFRLSRAQGKEITGGREVWVTQVKEASLSELGSVFSSCAESSVGNGLIHH